MTSIRCVFESFESLRITSRQHYKLLALVFDVFSNVLNLFESPVDQHYNVLALRFASFQSGRTTSRPAL